MSDQKTKIFLFISKESIYFNETMDEFKKLMKALEEAQPFSSEIIDVTENPEMAEKYKVDALPSLIIGDRRFIGKPNAEKIMEYIKRDKENKPSQA
jgi:hypothetical protein